MPLFLALSRRSEAWMLCVQRATRAEQVGCVHQVLPRLMFGYVARFSPEFDGGDIAMRVWLNVLANAWLLRLRQTRHARTAGGSEIMDLLDGTRLTMVDIAGVLSAHG